MVVKDVGALVRDLIVNTANTLWFRCLRGAIGYGKSLSLSEPCSWFPNDSGIMHGYRQLVESIACLHKARRTNSSDSGTFKTSKAVGPTSLRSPSPQPSCLRPARMRALLISASV